MKKETILGIFAASGIEVFKTWKIENKYWPDHSDYDEIRRENPWWLVKTNFGIVEIGRRKRVISIDWADTCVNYTVEDDVTKDSYSCHAWSTGKAVEYLGGLCAAMKNKGEK